MAKRVYTKTGTRPAGKSQVRKKLHVLLMGGSGEIMGSSLKIALMAAKDMPQIDVKLYVVDFDADSDSKAFVTCDGRVLGRLLQILNERQDTSRLLGALHSVGVAPELILNSTDYNKQLREYVLNRAGKNEQPEVEQALNLLLTTQIMDTRLGQGGLGNPSVGHVATCCHLDKINAMLDAAVEEIACDSSVEHAFVLLGSLIGSTAYNLLPAVLRNLTAHQLTVDLPVYAMLDGGVFLAHEAAYRDKNYMGTRDVSGKARAALSNLDQQGLLDCLSGGVFLTPLNRDGAPHKLCSESKLSGKQGRHTSIEYLIGIQVLLEMICGINHDNKLHHFYSSGSRVMDIRLSPDAPKRPLSWDDLDMDADSFLRVARMLGLGAATRTFIWDRDDDTIRNIPFVSSILRNSGASLSQVKAVGTEIASTCHHLLQQFYDYCVTGTNFEQENTENFSIEDNYRLMSIENLKKILRGDKNILFSMNALGDYRQVIGENGSHREKRVKASSLFDTNIKKCIDSVEKAVSVEDFYLQLFCKVR